MNKRHQIKILVILFSLSFGLVGARPGESQTATSRIALGAAQNDNFPLLIEKSKMFDFDVNATDFNGMSMLYHAVNNNNLTMTAFLIGCGATITMNILACALVRKVTDISQFLKKVESWREEITAFKEQRDNFLRKTKLTLDETGLLAHDISRCCSAGETVHLQSYENAQAINYVETVWQNFIRAVLKQDSCQMAVAFGMGAQMDEAGIKVFLEFVKRVEEHRTLSFSDTESVSSSLSDENDPGMENRPPSPAERVESVWSTKQKGNGLLHKLRHRLSRGRSNAI